MIQIYTYTLTAPDGSDPRGLVATLTMVLERMATHSENLVKVEVEGHEATSEIFMRIWFKDMDRWYIQKKIKFPVINALRKAGMDATNIRSVQVETPPDGRALKTPRKPRAASRWEPPHWLLEDTPSP